MKQLFCERLQRRSRSSLLRNAAEKMKDRSKRENRYCNKRKNFPLKRQMSKFEAAVSVDFAVSASRVVLQNS